MWTNNTITAIKQQNNFVIITIVAIKGSAPCVIGNKIIYSNKKSIGTIGGGNLEFSTLKHARKLLSNNKNTNEIKEYALGASLGQCCGGYVRIMFESFICTKSLQQSIAAIEHAIDFVLITIIGKTPINLSYSTANSLSDNQLDSNLQKKIITKAKKLLSSDTSTITTLKQTDATLNIYLESCMNSKRQNVAIFGAGHISRALMPIINKLPINIYWIDDREEEFKLYTQSTDNIRIICDDFINSISKIAKNSYCLVLSYSHQIDLDVCHKILSLDSFDYLGLIGSKTKKSLFNKKLINKGLEQQQIEKINCPIGVKHNFLKSPASIAISIAMDLVNFLEHKNKIPS